MILRSVGETKIRHYELNSNVNSVRVDNWTVELALIPSKPRFNFQCFSSCRRSTVKAGPAAVEPAQQSHGTRTNHVTARGQGHRKERRTTGSWWCTTRRTTLTLVYDLHIGGSRGA